MNRQSGDEDVSGDVIRVHHDPHDVDGSAWNALLERQANPTPFMRHEYLAALHASGSATADAGWMPQFVTVERQGRLVAAAPCYLKSHSWGEYVFDWAWADAYRRNGLHYYPKLVVAVPFTPVSGTRLMAERATDRERLVAALVAAARERKASSLHVLFHDEVDAGAARQAGWLLRRGVQFHWQADDHRRVASFDDLLASMHREKRKKILQDRRHVAQAGVHFTVHRGPDITRALRDFFHRCYTLTYHAHHSTPYLTREFFGRVADTMPDHWLMFVAHLAGEPIATSLVALDGQRQVAFGRYWGCTRHVPCLHFEACYYQPLQWCLDHGWRRFEGGAQGEHKMARGLLPVTTQSAHWLAHPRFSMAVDDFLRREGRGIDAYVDELRDHSPFKEPPGP